MTYQELRDAIETIFPGDTSDWEAGPSSVRFRTISPVCLSMLNRLSATIGHDRINFAFGFSGEADYSSWTPGFPGEGGYIEIVGTYL